MVELSRICDPSRGRILAKLEGFNPCGSKRDRVARQVLLDARREGILGPHQTVIGTGSEGAVLAMAMCCARMGHPFIAVLEGWEAECLGGSIQAFGGELVIVEGSASIDGNVVCVEAGANCAEVIECIQRERGAFHADPMESQASFRAHRLGTGQEILRQTRGEFYAFCSAVGSGGTLGGCAAAFKEYRDDILCYAVGSKGSSPESSVGSESGATGAEGAAILSGEVPLIDPDRVDGYIEVEEDEVDRELDALARREGILADRSSGIGLVAARRLLAGPCHGETVVVILSEGRSSARPCFSSGVDLGSSSIRRAG